MNYPAIYPGDIDPQYRRGSLDLCDGRGETTIHMLPYRREHAGLPKLRQRKVRLKHLWIRRHNKV